MESLSSSGIILSVSTLFNPSTKGKFYVQVISETAEVKKKKFSVKNNEPQPAPPPKKNNNEHVP